jgi:hypothetical protein
MDLSKCLLVIGLFMCLSCSKTDRTSKGEPALELVSTSKDGHPQKRVKNEGDTAEARRAVRFIENVYDKENKIIVSIRNHKKTATILVMQVSKQDDFYHTCFKSFINKVPVEINLDTCDLFSNSKSIKKYVKNSLLNRTLSGNTPTYQDYVFGFTVIQLNHVASFHINGTVAQEGDSLFIKKNSYLP